MIEQNQAKGDQLLDYNVKQLTDNVSCVIVLFCFCLWWKAQLCNLNFILYIYSIYVFGNATTVVKNVTSGISTRHGLS